MATGPQHYRPGGQRTLRRLTHLTTAVFDPVWTQDQHLVFTSFENFSFTIRVLDRVDSLLLSPRQQERMNLAHAGGQPWGFNA